jgi:hypothetical protein
MSAPDDDDIPWGDEEPGSGGSATKGGTEGKGKKKGKKATAKPPEPEPDIDELEKIIADLRAMFDAPTGTLNLWPPQISPIMQGGVALEVFNPRFALAFVGKDRYVFDKTKPLHFMGRASLASAWQAIRVDIGSRGKPVYVSLVTVWLAAIGADRYESFVFRPNEGQPGGRVWNVAENFITPKEGPTPSFDQAMGLLLDADRQWFLDWLADLVQNPCHLIGTAVCLTGPSRAGKSIIGNYIGRMLGRMYCLIESTVSVGHTFNAEERDALMIHYDEAEAGDTKRVLGVLKSKITAQTRSIEAKGVDKVFVNNVVRALFTSEHDPVPLMDGGMRARFAILVVAAKLVGERPFWNGFVAEMNGDGPARLLHRLLNRTITHDLRIAPTTTAARSNAKAHLPPLQRWLVESTEEDRFLAGIPRKFHGSTGEDLIEDKSVAWPEQTHIGAIYDALVDWWKDRRLRDEVPSREALAKMLRSLGCVYQGRLRIEGSRQGMWSILPPDQMAAAIKALWKIDID